MKRTLALLLAVMMVVSVFAGCSNKSNTETTAATAATTEAAQADGTAAEYTYHSYDTALGNNWNPHTWEVNADDEILSFITTPLVYMSILDSENGVYQWIYQAATSVEDVTAEHQDDLTKYKAALPEGKTAEDITEGYVYEIKLNPDMRWENGTPINADTYIYSMKQLLNPDMKNYRANLYYDGESAVAGGNAYYYSKTTGMYVPYTTAYATPDEAVADGKELFVNCYDFWGAKGYTDADGNEAPQYVSVSDETVYGEAQNDAFSGASLFADYGDYFADASGDYAQYLCFFQDNANYNDNMSYDDTVGFYKVDDYTVRYVNNTYISLDYFMTSLTSSFLVYEDLYEAGKSTTGELVTTDYGNSLDNTMSFGPYKIVSLQEDKQIVYEQNEEWFGYEKQADGSLISYTNFDVDGAPVQQYQATRIVKDVMDDAAAKQAFLKGDMSVWTPSADDLVSYSTSDRLYKTPETYTMSFFFDTNLDALKAMDASKGNTNSVVLSNVNFRKAMSLSVDREKYVAATAGYVPNYGLLNSLYYYNIYEDPTSSYRGSDEAMQAICNLYGVSYGEGTPYATLKDAYDSINGYNLTQAQELMKQACEELVADGVYTAGDPIYIRIGWAKGGITSADQNQVKLMNEFVNAAAKDSGFGTITLEAIGNINNRYEDVANGEYAIGYGAWGGAAFYPFRNFQVYCDPDQYSIHEAGCWDPKTETLTLNVDGEEVTMTWQAWSQSMMGVGKYASASNETKLSITAQMEEAYLQKYYRIPLCSTTVCEMLAYQVDYYTDVYNVMYDFGGLRLMKFNYTDAEWADYVASQGGTLSYE